MDYPDPGSYFEIHSYKHDGTLHRVWQSNILLNVTDTSLLGGNDSTNVIESDGSMWTTGHPAICYFHTEHWFNVIGMIRSDGIYYYCNLGSPFIFEGNIITYIDYDLDVQVYPDMTYELLDDDEFLEHKKAMDYPESLESRLYEERKVLIDWISQRKGPFQTGFIDEWYKQFLLYN